MVELVGWRTLTPTARGRHPTPMGKTHIETTIVIRAPLAVVFERLTDHESMRDWPGVSSCKVITDGAPTKNGLGAVRRITTLGLSLDEKIVRFDPPNGYDYTIVRGLPVKHLGTLRLAEANGATTV